MKTLLAIINEPAESKEFIQYTMHLAKDLQSSVHFMHILNPDNFILGVPGAADIASVDVQQQIDSLAEASRKQLEAIIQRSSQELSLNVEAGFSVQTGTASLFIRDLVDQGKAGMVVLEGEEGNHFWSQSLTNLDVIRHVNCPVWIAPYKATYKDLKRILYATDYKEEDVTTLNRLLEMTRDLSPEITALHVTSNLDFEERVKKAGFIEILRRHTKYDKLSVKVMADTEDGDMATMISEYAHLHKTDLVVLLRENRHFLDRIFSADQTKEMLEHSVMPLLVFHEKE